MNRRRCSIPFDNGSAVLSNVPKRSIFWCASLAFLFCVPHITAAAGPSDFGAETIEQESSKPLPVDQAEEQGAPAVAKKTPKANKNSPHTNTSDEPEETYGSLPETPKSTPNIDNEVTTVLNVKDVEIAALVKSFSKITGRNFIVDSTVKGKVTIHLQTPVTLDEGLKILDSVLLLKGFATVPVGPNTYKVIAAKEARQTTVPLLGTSPKNPSDALVTQLIRLRYVQATDMQQALQQFVSKDGYLSAFGGTNSLIVIDSAANIERLGKLVRQLDVPALDQDITIIPIHYAEAKDVAEKIESILGEKDKSSSNTGSTIRPMIPIPIGQTPPGVPQPIAATTPGSSASSSTSAKRALPLKVIPDERTNSVIVVADQETTLKVRAIVEQLDSKVDLSGGRFFVYRLKHADAEELADVLNAVISGGESSSSRRSSDRSTSSSGSSLSRRGSRNSLTRSSRSTFSDRSSGLDRDTLGSTDRSARGSYSPTVVTAGGKDGQGGRVNFEGEVSIAADTATNSLIINASRADYLKVKEVLDELDVKRKQVLVEGTILEVSLKKNEGAGVEFQLTGATDQGGVVTQTNFDNLTNLLTNPTRLTDLTIAAASTGSLTLPGNITIPSQAALISAVSRNQNVNVLSSPTILTTDNEEAEIVVGENVPFVTSTGTSDVNLNNTFNQIEREDVGITLRITPQIGFGDFVNLKIFVEISNVVSTTRNDPNGPTTNIRTTETNVEVKSDQMIVTGGLISDSITDSSRGVPYWQDIPVLGNLFRRDDTDRSRTNLLIFITPRIVNDQFDAREATVEKRDYLKKVIEEQNTEPDRAEVLNSDKMDRVFEESPDNKFSPSTITPPNPPKKLTSEEEGALKRTQEAFRILEKHSSEMTPPSETSAPRSNQQQSNLREEELLHEDVSAEIPRAEKSQHANIRGDILPPEQSASDLIDITVSPKLPSVGTGASSAKAAAPIDESPGGQKLFVVMRELGNGSNTFGIVAVGEKAGKFFDIGARYRHESAAGDQQVVCLGKYLSRPAAARVHPQLNAETQWRELTPKELVSLGRNEWLKM